MFLMKTCIVGSGSAEDAREETGDRDDKEEMLLERMLEWVMDVYAGVA